MSEGVRDCKKFGNHCCREWFNLRTQSNRTWKMCSPHSWPNQRLWNPFRLFILTLRGVLRENMNSVTCRVPFGLPQNHKDDKWGPQVLSPGQAENWKLGPSTYFFVRSWTSTHTLHHSIPVVPKLFTVPYPFRHLISNSDWNCLQIPSSKYNRNLRIIIISRLKKQTCTALIMF